MPHSAPTSPSLFWKKGAALGFICLVFFTVVSLEYRIYAIHGFSREHRTSGQPAKRDGKLESRQLLGLPWGVFGGSQNPAQQPKAAQPASPAVPVNTPTIPSTQQPEGLLGSVVGQVGQIVPNVPVPAVPIQAAPAVQGVINPFAQPVPPILGAVTNPGIDIQGLGGIVQPVVNGVPVTVPEVLPHGGIPPVVTPILAAPASNPNAQGSQAGNSGSGLVDGLQNIISGIVGAGGSVPQILPTVTAPLPIPIDAGSIPQAIPGIVSQIAPLDGISVLPTNIAIPIMPTPLAGIIDSSLPGVVDSIADPVTNLGGVVPAIPVGILTTPVVGLVPANPSDILPSLDLSMVPLEIPGATALGDLPTNIPVLPLKPDISALQDGVGQVTGMMSLLGSQLGEPQCTVISAVNGIMAAVAIPCSAVPSPSLEQPQVSGTSPVSNLATATQGSEQGTPIGTLSSNVGSGAASSDPDINPLPASSLAIGTAGSDMGTVIAIPSIAASQPASTASSITGSVTIKQPIPITGSNAGGPGQGSQISPNPPINASFGGDGNIIQVTGVSVIGQLPPIIKPTDGSMLGSVAEGKLSCTHAIPPLTGDTANTAWLTRVQPLAGQPGATPEPASPSGLGAQGTPAGGSNAAPPAPNGPGSLPSPLGSGSNSGSGQGESPNTPGGSNAGAGGGGSPTTAQNPESQPILCPGRFPIPPCAACPMYPLPATEDPLMGPCPGRGYSCSECLDGWFCPPQQTPIQRAPCGWGWPCYHCDGGWYCAPGPVSPNSETPVGSGSESSSGKGTGSGLGSGPPGGSLIVITATITAAIPSQNTGSIGSGPPTNGNPSGSASNGGNGPSSGGSGSGTGNGNSGSGALSSCTSAKGSQPTDTGTTPPGNGSGNGLGNDSGNDNTKNRASSICTSSKGTQPTDTSSSGPPGNGNDNGNGSSGYSTSSDVAPGSGQPSSGTPDTGSQGSGSGNNGTPTNAGAAKAAAQVSGWKYVGCFKDSPARTLDCDPKDYFAGSMSNEKCIQHCGSKGFRLAGTEYQKECWCGNSFQNATRLPESRCNAVCDGCSTDICGGDWAITVYSTDGFAVGMAADPDAGKSGNRLSTAGRPQEQSSPHVTAGPPQAPPPLPVSAGRPQPSGPTPQTFVTAGIPSPTQSFVTAGIPPPAITSLPSGNSQNQPQVDVVSLIQSILDSLLPADPNVGVGGGLGARDSGAPGAKPPSPDYGPPKNPGYDASLVNAGSGSTASNGGLSGYSADKRDEPNIGTKQMRVMRRRD